MRLIVLMAVSGAGKDHFAAHNLPKANTLASADDYFGTPYKFDPTKLGEAHGACFRKVIEALQRKEELVVVNNTNTSLVEIAPYMVAAQAYGADANIIWLSIPPVIAAKRNVHGVDLSTVIKMNKRLEETFKSLPPWWDKEVLQWDDKKSAYAPLDLATALSTLAAG
jgi:predicted kinase